jgi:hypothetical protein
MLIEKKSMRNQTGTLYLRCGLTNQKRGFFGHRDCNNNMQEKKGSSWK